MALILPLRGFTPKIGRDCFLAENATVVGDTTYLILPGGKTASQVLSLIHI